MLDPAVVSGQVKRLQDDVTALRADFTQINGPVDTLRYLLTHTWTAGEFNTWMANTTNANNLNRLISTDTGAAAIGMSDSAMAAIANNSSAMWMAVNNTLALRIWAASQIACNQLLTSSIALDVLLSRPSVAAMLFDSSEVVNGCINSQVALDKICASTEIKSLFIASRARASVSVPYMTTNTTPYGVCSASSISNASYEAFKPFMSYPAWWYSANMQTTNQWLCYEFLYPVFITSFDITQHPSSPSVDLYRIESSTNGTNWDIHFTGNGATGSNSYQLGTFKVGMRKRWRLFMVSAYSSTTVLTIQKLNFRGFQ